MHRVKIKIASANRWRSTRPDSLRRRDTISDHYKSYRYATSYQLAQSILLDEPVQLAVGDLIQDPQKGGAGFVVRNNTLIETNIGRPQPQKAMHGGAISISRPNAWQSRVGHADITIENNRFIDIPGSQIQVNAAEDVVIRDRVSEPRSTRPATR